MSGLSIFLGIIYTGLKEAEDAERRSIMKSSASKIIIILFRIALNRLRIKVLTAASKVIRFFYRKEERITHDKHSQDKKQKR